MSKMYSHTPLILAVIAFVCTDAINETFYTTFLTPNGTIPTSPSTINETFPTTLHVSSDLLSDEDKFRNKHESFKECQKFDLEPDEFVMFPNGTAFVAAYNMTYDSDFYVLHDNFLIVCVPNFKEEPTSSPLASETLEYLTVVGVGISMVFLLIHLVVFALVRDLQNLPGCNLASLCLSLFLSYLSMIISKSEHLTENTIVCIASAILTQFFFLGSFLWMFIMSFDVFRSILHATGSLRVSNKSFKVKKFVCNSLIIWGTSFVFAAAALIVDNVDGVPEDYRPHFEKFCWFSHKHSLLTFFAGPVLTLICLNFILFGISAYSIYSNRMKSSTDCQRSNLKKSHLMYLRLSVIMGATWITGALAPLTSVLWMWYLFVALNTLQGLFIFIAFTYTTKVRKYFRVKLFGGRRPSEQNLTPTFQSYCFYANSIEKDLDKVVDSKDKSDTTDTIVIHL